MCVYETALEPRSRGTDRTMTSLQRIVIVDDGERALDTALSAELAELGYASVTTSLETTDEVLALIPTPAAIVLQIPRGASVEDRARFQALADRLRARRGAGGPPVIVLDPREDSAGSTVGERLAGGFSALLEPRVGKPAMARPER